MGRQPVIPIPHRAANPRVHLLDRTALIRVNMPMTTCVMSPLIARLARILPIVRAGSGANPTQQSALWDATVFTTKHPGSANSCQYAYDNMCDEPYFCQIGTDTADCQRRGLHHQAGKIRSCHPPPVAGTTLPRRGAGVRIHLPVYTAKRSGRR